MQITEKIFFTQYVGHQADNWEVLRHCVFEFWSAGKNAAEHTGHMTDYWQSSDTQYLQFDRKLQKTYPCYLCFVARILSIDW